jgi:HD-like signal output (HDOD) protein
LRAGIERYYGIAVESIEVSPAEAADENANPNVASQKLAAIPTLIRQLKDLPALPITIKKLREAIESSDVSPRDVGNIISTDPPLAAKLLQLANSPAFGFPNQISSVSLAVSLLGMRETCSVALTAAVVDLLHGSRYFDYKSFWVRSMLCGTICKTIARIAGHGDTPGIFTAGVLLDLGRLALAEVAPQRYATLNSELRGPQLIAAEERLLGVAHPEAGYLLAHAWGLPQELTETIRFHHMPEYAQLSRFTASLAMIANTMVYLKPEERENPEIELTQCGKAFANLSLPQEDIIAILDETRRILKSSFLLQRRWDSDTRHR